MKQSYIKLFMLGLALITCAINADSEVIKGKVYTPGNSSNFEKILEMYDLVFVDFYAEWCGPCKQMHKIIDSLAQDSQLDNVLFVKVNTDEQRDLSAQYHISSLPTFILFVDGKPIKTIYGYKDKKALKQIITETFAS